MHMCVCCVCVYECAYVHVCMCVSVCVGVYGSVLKQPELCDWAGLQDTASGEGVRQSAYRQRHQPGAEVLLSCGWHSSGMVTVIN